MGDYGMKVSLAGNDVETANLQQTAFSSKYPLFKIAFSGNITVNAVGNGSINPGKTTVTFNHNLGYIPAFRCYVYIDTNNNKRQSLDLYSSFGLANTSSLVARATTTQLILKAFNFNAQSFSVTVYYYIYVDSS